MTPSLTVALIAIARPTFDVPLAQSVADRALRQLQEAGLTVISTGNELLMDADGAERAIAGLQGATIDLLILLQASFADSSMAIQIASAVDGMRRAKSASAIPVLLWAVPDAREGGRLRLNSLCGINLAAHAFMLNGLQYDYLLCQPDDVAAFKKITTLGRAGQALRMLNGARLGLVGQHPAGFDTCRYDAGDLAQLFGSEVVTVGLSSVLRDAKQADEEKRDHFLTKVASFAPNLNELDATATRGTAGVYVALRELVETQKLKGMAVRCWPEFFTELGCAACGAMSMLNEEKYPASCEADVNGTLTLVLLQALSGSQSFVTDLVSIDGESDTGVLWHCGLAPVSMADPEHGVSGALHSNRKLPLLFEFPLKPGRVTIARLHRRALPPAFRSRSTGPNGFRDAYQLVIGGGEMIQAPRAFTGTSGVIRFDKPANEVFDRVMRHGLEHHFCITYGDCRDELRAVAALTELEVLELC